MFGVPGDLLVEFHHAVAERGDRHEPGRHRPIDQRIAAPPAVRIGVLVGLVAEQHRAVRRRRAAAVLQVADDVRVGVKDVLPLVIRDGGVEAALGIDRRDRHDADLVGGRHVVFAVGRRHVHDPGAVLGGHELPRQHLKSLGAVHEIREGRQVARAEQVGPTVGTQYLGLFTQLAGVGGQPRLRQHETMVAGPNLDVGDLGVDRDRQVRRQGPRCRRPHQQVRAVQRAAHHPESDGERRVLAALVDVVVHPQFVVGQRGFVAPAVRQDPVALVRQALVPELLERPDHRLHVGQIERLVVVVEIDPAGLAGHIRLPLVGVAQDRFAAGIVERGDPHVVDLGLVGDAQLTFDFEFGGQPVGVPAEPALNLVAAHGAVPRDDVFDVAGEQVPVVRQPVGERRPVVEDVFRGPVAAGDAGPEGVVAGPVVEHLEFERREVGRPGLRIRLDVGVISHDVASSPVPLRPGTTTRGVRERRGTTPLAVLSRGRSSKAVTGLPVRFYWARLAVLPKAPR